MSDTAASKRRTLWILFAVAASLFAGSILFIVSRVH
jgi:hypothetical protein